MICWLLPYKVHYTYCALAEMTDTAPDRSLVIHNAASHNSILPYAFWSGAANPAKNSIAYRNTTVIRNFSHTPIVHSDDPTAVVDSIRHCRLTVLPAFQSYVRIFFLNDRWYMIDSRFPTELRDASCSSCPSTDTVYYFTQTAFIGSHRVDTRTVINSTFVTATHTLLDRPPLSCTKNNGWLILNPDTLFACIVVDRSAPALPENLYVYTAAERCWLIHVFKAHHKRQDIYTQWFLHNLEDSSDLRNAYKQINSPTRSLSESKNVCAELAKILYLHKATHQENGGNHGETERLQIPPHT